jgi:hypothetical protein
MGYFPARAERIEARIAACAEVSFETDWICSVFTI